MSMVLRLTEAESDLLYQMLTQRAYLRENDPDRKTVETLRDDLYPMTSAYREYVAALKLIGDEDNIETPATCNCLRCKTHGGQR